MQDLQNLNFLMLHPFAPFKTGMMCSCFFPCVFSFFPRIPTSSVIYCQRFHVPFFSSLTF